jgi:hypothetical protein
MENITVFGENLEKKNWSILENGKLTALFSDALPHFLQTSFITNLKSINIKDF